MGILNMTTNECLTLCLTLIILVVLGIAVDAITYRWKNRDIWRVK